jgi:signal peptidase I
MIEHFKSEKDYYHDLIKQFLIAILIALVFRSFFYEPYRIPSGSMKSNLLVGDHIFVSKYAYGFSRYSLPLNAYLLPGEKRVMQYNKPERGDIIVFRGPKNPHMTYIKRLIGLPGDDVQVINGIVYINGNEIKRIEDGKFIDDDDGVVVKKYIEILPNNISYNVLDRYPNGEGELDNTKVFHVPEGSYFFMGDNRDQSGDSRVMEGIGFVPEQFIVGKAEIIFFSSKEKIWTLWNLFTAIDFSRSFISLKPVKHTN